MTSDQVHLFSEIRRLLLGFAVFDDPLQPPDFDCGIEYLASAAQKLRMSEEWPERYQRLIMQCKLELGCAETALKYLKNYYKKYE